MVLLTPDELKEVTAMFAASRARNDALTRKQRFEAGKFTIELAASVDDPPGNDSVFQNDLSTFGKALRTAGIQYSQTAIAFDAVDAQGYPLPEFIIAIKDLGIPVITVIATLAGGWVQARYGRKMRLKIGDVEAEGRTIKEIEELLKKAAQFRDDSHGKGEEK